MHTCTCSHTHTHTQSYLHSKFRKFLVAFVTGFEDSTFILFQTVCMHSYFHLLLNWIQSLAVWLTWRKKKWVCVMICVLGTWLWLDLQCLHYRLFKCQVASGEVLEVCPALDWHHQNVSALYAFCVILFMGILKKKRCLCWDCSRETVLWKDSVY